MYGIEGAPSKRTSMWPMVLSEVLPACGGYFYRMVRAGCRFSGAFGRCLVGVVLPFELGGLR